MFSDGMISSLLYEVDLAVLGVSHLPVFGKRSQRVLVRGVAGVRVRVLRALRGCRRDAVELVRWGEGVDWGVFVRFTRVSYTHRGWSSDQTRFECSPHTHTHVERLPDYRLNSARVFSQFSSIRPGGWISVNSSTPSLPDPSGVIQSRLHIPNTYVSVCNCQTHTHEINKHVSSAEVRVKSQSRHWFLYSMRTHTISLNQMDSDWTKMNWINCHDLTSVKILRIKIKSIKITNFQYPHLVAFY